MILSSTTPGRAELLGSPVINFASASYLGLEVGRWLREAGVAWLDGWGLTTGLPSSVANDALSLALAQELATFVGAEAALAGPSALHLLLDAVGALAGPRGTVALPRHAYTLIEVVGQRARGMGCTVLRYTPDRLDRLATRLRSAKRPLVILAASFEYPGVPTPLELLWQLALSEEAFLLVDDTLAMGVLGRRVPGKPQGVGGGGGVLWSGLRPCDRLLQVAGLSKAFSVPLAFVSGSRWAIDKIRRHGEVLPASSAADLVSIQTARWALQVNASSGEALRRALRQAVALLREAGGLSSQDAGFPVLSRYYPDLARARAAGCRLLRLGLWGLLDPCPRERPVGEAALRFNVSAAHAGPLAARALAIFQRINHCSGERAAA